ncbi:MAG: phosphoribosylformylglycinamidine cyclo-ligase [Tannerellaceae bacterium]|jgi:phosphoribosylformylglycinamidine cyclo-ligase|nr:phosphoribosylformylglycinamidine cyclo-ligase [Tannerellaceae bacterium]
MTQRYDRRGVSASKDDVHRAIRNIDKGLFPKAFCKIVPDFIGGDPAFCNVMHADGAGTKSSLAYVYWRETGDLSVWKGIAQDALIMNIDDLACVGATGPILISSTIGRNKRLIPGEVISVLINALNELAERLSGLGINCCLTGGETADVGDLVRTIIVDSTVCCRMRRDRVVDNSRIRGGDIIVGLSSVGQATYESAPNSGMGSNGLTSARHDLFARLVAEKYPESYDSGIPPELAYSGSLLPTSAEEGLEPDAGRAVLSPTRTYAPIIRRMLDTVGRDRIHGMVHCTGGGQTKIMHFVENMRVVKNNLFPVPPLFRIIKEQSGATEKEMYSVFNMGHRMEIYVAPEDAEAIISVSRSFGVDAQAVGYVEASDRNELIIESEKERIVYV